jgi:hypothetical protein
MRVSTRGIWNVRTRPAWAIAWGGRRSMRWPAKVIVPPWLRRKPEIRLKAVV